MSHKEREQLHAEFSILHSLRHPNIVAYYHREHLKASQDLHLYMEYCGNGDLARLIKKLKERNQMADEDFVWSIFTQLVTALYRCHYGIDAPEIGTNIMGVGVEARGKPVMGKSQVMILHRDLKPENSEFFFLDHNSEPAMLTNLVFLGADNSVKLGDFGLSKIMQSHDFASTYVGTPFYMSPEICAAERYTLHSDIWSLGCIMYELCAREPPFSAKTHFHLVEKIKGGKLAPLPSVYSAELQTVIKSCLKVNPTQRPDTAALLNLPVVKLMRKEREVVDMGKILRTKEQLTAQRLQEVEEKVRHMEAETDKMRQEMEASIRREWEVKARLEIDRQVQIEKEHLQAVFERELTEQVQVEVQKQLQIAEKTKMENFSNIPAHLQTVPQSSVSTTAEEDFPSGTDLTALSLDSPASSPKWGPKKTARTPFSRSRTTFDSPMDIQMADPSPMSIAGLSLSPRRRGFPGHAANATGLQLFGSSANQYHRMQPLTLDPSDDEDEDEDDMPPPPSPTRQKPLPHKAPRPSMTRTKTAPMGKLASQPNLFGTPAVSAKVPPLPSLISQPDIRVGTTTGTATSNLVAGILFEKTATSPTRRMSKIPSSTNLHSADAVKRTSPVRPQKTTVNKSLFPPTSNNTITSMPPPPAPTTTTTTVLHS